MPVEWSGLGPEILITIDRNGDAGLRAQLEDQLRDAIRGGRLADGERLPSSRAFSDALGLSRGLVQDCYWQLQAEGYLTSHPGSATRVAPGAHRQDAPPLPDRPAPDRRPWVADFRHGVPDLGLAPRSDWAWSIREVCRTAPNTVFDYGDPAGEPGLREVLAAYLWRVRAMTATSERVVVCAGMAQALGLVLGALADEGIDTSRWRIPAPSARRPTKPQPSGWPWFPSRLTKKASTSPRSSAAAPAQSSLPPHTSGPRASCSPGAGDRS